jgi:exportin-T
VICRPCYHRPAANPTVLRNKLALTLAQLFTSSYPDIIPTFLHPFLNLLVPQDGATNLHLPLLVTHLLVEIAQEIHDATTREFSRRSMVWAKELNLRDGRIRDAIRSSGDERLAVDGLLTLARKGLGQCNNAKWLEVTDFAIRALAAWTRE